MAHTTVRVRTLLSSTMLENKTDSKEKYTYARQHQEHYPSASTTQPQAKPASNNTHRTWSNHNIQTTLTHWGIHDPAMVSKFHDLGTRRFLDVRHEWNCPNTVIRFLLAAQGDIELADWGFRRMLRWRKQHQVDSLMQTYKPPTILFDNYPGAILRGLDKEGDPIYLGRMGVTDLSGMLDQVGFDALYKYEIYKREAGMTGQWRHCYEKLQGRTVKRILIVEDLHGLNRKTHLNSRVLAFFQQVMKFNQDCYCESTKKIILIRAPKIFEWGWSIISKFLAPIIREKVEVCSHDNYLEVLARNMDVRDLPPEVNPASGTGGSVDDPVFSPRFIGGKLKAADNAEMKHGASSKFKK